MSLDSSVQAINQLRDAAVQQLTTYDAEMQAALAAKQQELDAANAQIAALQQQLANSASAWNTFLDALAGALQTVLDLVTARRAQG